MVRNRRDFLKQSLLAASAGSSMLATASWGQLPTEKSHRPTVAAIGVGGSMGRYNRGRDIAREAAKLGTMVAVCEVVDKHAEEFNAEMGGQLKTYRDYRKLLEEVKPDIVTIGTPDHWHVPISVAALRSGCDVYCEKPLTLTIDEGKQICRVVEETGRVFQVGTQQRSEYDRKFLQAVAVVQSGRLGKDVNAYVAIGSAPGEGPFPNTPVPSGIDWDRWLGPAPAVDYCEERRRMFRWWFEYSGGKMTDWGAHHIDIAQWALGFADSGPVSVAARGKFPEIVPADLDWKVFLDGNAKLPNGFNTAVQFSIDLKFGNGSVINVNDYYRQDDGTEFENGILFEGEKGRIFVNRERLSGLPIESLTEADQRELDAAILKLCKGKAPGHHMGNFFACVEDRSQPISDVWTHHRIMTSCHLCNIALMLGRELTWDPQVESFVNDAQAVSLMSRTSRQTYL